MDIVISLPEALKLAFQPLSIGFVMAGLLIGIMISAMPGVGANAALAALLPLTIGFEAEYAVFLFVGVLIGCEYGNSIPAILIRVPGTTSAVLTCVEGYEFQRRGEGGKALGISLISACVGQFFSIIFFVLLMAPLIELSIRFMFPEKFALYLLGLSSVVGLTGKSPVRGIVSVAIGLAVGTIGPDPISGYPRFSFGNQFLSVGLQTVPVVIGMLAVSELLAHARQSVVLPRVKVNLSHILPSWKEVKEFRTGTLVGTIVGLIVGALPGAGPTAASFIAYQQIKLFSKQKERFGKGSPDAVAALDAAQNACIGGDLVPTFALGVPGSAPMIMILAALTIHGVVPGPGIMQSYPPAIYATVGGLVVATLLLFPVGLAVLPPCIRLMTVHRSTVALAALITCFVAVYTLRWASFDVYVLLGAGLLGYLMRRFGFPLAPAALAVVLGDPLEVNLRTGLVMMYGSWGAFLLRPAVMIILAMAVACLFWPFISERWRRRRERRSATPDPGSCRSNVE